MGIVSDIRMKIVAKGAADFTKGMGKGVWGLRFSVFSGKLRGLITMTVKKFNNQNCECKECGKKQLVDTFWHKECNIIIFECIECGKPQEKEV